MQLDLLPHVLDVSRVATGAFFALSGYHKLFNPGRHKVLADTLRDLGLPRVGFLQWWVPGWEFAGGLMVISGYWPAVIVGGGALIVICAIACLTAGKQRVRDYQPIDLADTVDDWLYLPEVLYVLLLALAMAEAVETGAAVIL